MRYRILREVINSMVRYLQMSSMEWWISSSSTREHDGNIWNTLFNHLIDRNMRYRIMRKVISMVWYPRNE